jgi:hypothetical protein
MASSYTTNLGFEKQTDGENSSTWGQKVNTVFDLIEDAIAGVGSISMTADANKTLTDTDGAADESRSAILEFTSTLSLTATRSIIVPTSGKIYVVKNGTTGGQSLTITTVSGTGVTVANGDIKIVYCNGTNILEAGAADQTAAEIKTLLENGIDSIHYVDGSIDNEHIADNAIDSEHYADGSIDTAHIADDQITVAKMATNSIDSDQYVDGSIDNAHMAANSIDSDQYVDGSIDNAHMAANSIDSDQYVDGSIDNAHMAANSIDSDQYVDGSIDAAHLSATLGDLRRGVTHVGRDANDHIQIDTNMIRFYIDGVNVMSCDASGNIIAKGNVTAYGTPA